MPSPTWDLDVSRVAAPRAGELKPAGLWPRTKAFGVDYLFIAGYLVALSGTVWELQHTPLKHLFATLYASPYTAQLTDAAMFDVPVMLYFALFDASHWQATPGKRRIGLRVVTTAGGRVSLLRALGRIVLKFLPWEIAHTAIWHTPGWPRNPQPTTLDYAAYALVYVLAGGYVVSLLASPTRRTLYDRLTSTRVVFAPEHLTGK